MRLSNRLVLVLVALVACNTEPAPGDGDGDGDGSPVEQDCNDADALVFPGATEACADGIDNDCDALLDCEDVDCAGAVNCGSESSCDDGIDNNADGLVDCEDMECALDPSCGLRAQVTGGTLSWTSSTSLFSDDCQPAPEQSFNRTFVAHNVTGVLRRGAEPACAWQVATAQGSASGSSVGDTVMNITRTGFTLDAGCPTTGSDFLPKQLTRVNLEPLAFAGLAVPAHDGVETVLWYTGGVREVSRNTYQTSYHTSSYQAGSVPKSCFVTSQYGSVEMAIDALEPGGEHVTTP